MKQNNKNKGRDILSRPFKIVITASSDFCHVYSVPKSEASMHEICAIRLRCATQKCHKPRYTASNNFCRSLLMADFNIIKFMVEVAEDVVVSVTDEHTL